MTPATIHKQFSVSKLFYAGLGLVMLSLWLPFIPDWQTFIHVWRVELFASVFLLGTLSYLLLTATRSERNHQLSAHERNFIVLPMLAFILWSGISALWAPSWKSALHHALVWGEYLIFYCIVRYALTQPGQFRRFINVFAFSLIMFAVPAIAGYCAFLIFGGSNTLGVRFARFGELVVTLTPLILACVVAVSGRRFVIGLLSLTALWLMIFCSFGRTNIFLFIGGVTAIGFLVVLIGRFHRYRRKFAVVAAVLAIAPATLHVFTFFSPAAEIPLISRFRDETGLSNSNDFRKLMISLSAEMIADKPLTGIGADNFGFEVHKYRAAYAIGNAGDLHLAQAENDLPERAHNEFLQIVAELGAVGGAIMLWFMFGIGLMAFRALRSLGKLPLHAPAAVLGLLIFLASSLVTSYSFRLIQNGFVFFFVLAVAAKFYLKVKSGSIEEKQIEYSPLKFKLTCSAGVVICLMLTLYSTVRLSSVIATQTANANADLTEAAKTYSLAMQLDDENPLARNNFGMRLFNEERYPEAIPFLKAAIDMGLATSTEYSYLASAQFLAGDHQGAEETMKHASFIYPYSPFVLTRYAALLESNGRGSEAADFYARAEKISPKVAITWRAVITEGPQAASKLAINNDRYLTVMELQPQRAIYAVVTERLIRFPEERRFSMLPVGRSRGQH